MWWGTGILYAKRDGVVAGIKSLEGRTSITSFVKYLYSFLVVVRVYLAIFVYLIYLCLSVCRLCKCYY